jgi:hypothetical protein
MKRLTSFLFVLVFTILFSRCSKNNSPTDTTNPTDTNDPKTISVAISSMPTGAQILVNGSSSDKTTPYTFSNLTSGNYQFMIKKTDYDSTIHSYYLVEGDHKQIVDTLKPFWSGSVLSDLSAGFYTTNAGNAVYSNNYIFPSTLTVPTNLTAKVKVIYSTSDNVYADGGQIWIGDLNTPGANSLNSWQGISDFVGFLPKRSNDTITFVIDKNKYPSGTKGKMCFGVVNGKSGGFSFGVTIHEAFLIVE